MTVQPDSVRRFVRAHAALTALVPLALYFVATVVAGLINSYSPVPFWDTWAGALGFYIAHQIGDLSIWWAQHNEHRIVLSRALFWLDYELANGSGILLLGSHLVLMGLAVFVFVLFSRQLLTLTPAQQRRSDILCASVLTIWLFQWIQAENIAWEFQSQFFMAQTLPLLALYLLARASTADSNHSGRRWFSAACLAGVASVGTMANGIICLPLMLAYVLVTRQSWQRVVILALLSVLMLTLYFHNYQSPPSHGSVLTALTQQPLALAHYVLLYLGTPFYYLLNGSHAPRLAIVATIFMAAVTVTALIRCVSRLWRNTDQASPAQTYWLWQLALVFYIIYLAGTALGTGGGRLVFGVNQALTFRYTTPALMAWAATFVLLLPLMRQRWSSLRWILLPTAVLILLPLLAEQHKTLQVQHAQRFDRAVAALALELGIRDETRINAVYEMSNGLLDIVERSRRRQLSVFARYPWQGLREQMNQFYPLDTALPACMGHIDVVTAVAPDQDHLLIQGWLLDPVTHQPAQRIRLIDEQNMTRGFALGGGYRPDVEQALGLATALTSGIAGYVSTLALGQPVSLLAEGSACVLHIPSLAITP